MTKHDPDPQDLEALLTDLRAHQIELEMQNHELRRAHEQLEASKTRYVELYELAPMGYITLDERGVILQSNLRAANLLDSPRASLVGASFYTFLAHEVRDAFYLLCQQLTHTHAPRSQELPLLRQGSTPFWARLHVVKTSPTGPFLLSLVDITSAREAEEQRRLLEAKLLEGQRLESLGVLSGGVAHDFNNLLTAIVCNASVAATILASDDDEPISPFLDGILLASEQAAALVSQMLAYTGKRSLVLENLDINALIRNTSSLLQSAISKNVHLEYDLAPELPLVEGDVAQLRQVLINLVTNASEACADTQGTIVVKTRVEHDLDPPSPCVVLECLDTGCGMSAQTQARIFDPFFTTKFAGRGLGLAATTGIVRGHSGTLTVTSEVGVGSTFTLKLPAFAAELEPPPAAVESSDWTGSGTILVAEDMSQLRALVTVLLEKLGFSVILAKDGLEAVELFREHHAELVCVLLDNVMPRMKGVEAYHEIRKHPAFNRVPIIITTGYSVRDVLQSAPQIQGVLPKPYDRSRLRNLLREVLGDG